MNLFIEVTQTVLFIPARLLAQVEYSYSASSEGQAPGPLFWIFLAGVHDLSDRSLLENLYKGRPARMGLDYPDL
jgi:hypothetical protein